jgi:hypothetical protein
MAASKRHPAAVTGGSGYGGAGLVRRRLARPRSTWLPRGGKAGAGRAGQAMDLALGPPGGPSRSDPEPWPP